MLVPDDVAAALRRPDPRPGLGAAPGRPGDPQGRRLPDLPPRRRRRRPRDGHHPRRARRGVDQHHPQARPALPLARAWRPPAFAHMPLLRNTDKSKISKRKNPAARLTWFQEQGYLPEALVNFLALLAYPPKQDAEGNDVEVFTFEEFSRATSTGAKVNPVGPDLRPQEARAGSTASTSATLEVGDLATPAAALPPARRRALGQPVPGRAGPAQVGHRADPDAHGPADRGQRPGRARSTSPTTPLEIADDARAQLKDDADEVLAAAIGVLEGIDDTGTGVLGSESGWNAAAIEAALRDRDRRRPGHQAQVRLRPAAHRRVRPAHLAAAVRVDGDPGQDLDADPAAPPPRRARPPAEEPIWERVTGAGSIATRFTATALRPATVIPPWGMV